MPKYNESNWTESQHAFWYDFFAPFHATVRQREGPGGMMLSYVTGQTVMNRLDDLVGPHNWEDSYAVVGHIVICTLTITTPWGQRVTKSDCGDMEREFKGKIEINEKGGFTDAFKRACVKFGIGRHLYDEGLPLLFEDGRPQGLGPPRSPSDQAGMDSLLKPNGDSLEPPKAPLGPRKATDPDLFQVAPTHLHQLIYWIKALGHHYDLNLLKVVNKSIHPRPLTDLEPEEISGIVTRIINYVRKKPEYKGELDGLVQFRVAALKGEIRDLAGQFYRHKFPQDTKPFGPQDIRITALISKFTQGQIGDIELETDAAVLDHLATSIAKALDEVHAPR